MHRRGTWLLVALGASLSAPSGAEEIDIWKEEGAVPRVSCSFAKRHSAQAVYRFLGEPFEVGDQADGTCVEVAPTVKKLTSTSGGPLIGPINPSGPGVGPIGPRCKCPTTYEAELNARLPALTGDGLTIVLPPSQEPPINPTVDPRFHEEIILQPFPPGGNQPIDPERLEPLQQPGELGGPRGPVGGPGGR